MASDPFSPIIKPVDGQSTLPISFTDAGFSSTTQLFIPGPSGPYAPQELDLSASDGPLSDTTPTHPHSVGGKLFTSSEFKPLPDHTVDHLMNGEGCPPSACSINPRVSHMSQPGIVQLHSLPSAFGSPRVGSHGSDDRTHSLSTGRLSPSTNDTTSSQGMHPVAGTQDESKTRDVSNSPSSGLESVELNAAGDSFAAGYCHGADESGYYVAIGPESGTRRIEDEVHIL